MRPIVSERNLFRYPLNEILGTEAHVRLLRVLAKEVEGPLSASEAARLAGLTVRGAQKALTRLSGTPFVTLTGGGRRHLYRLQNADNLVQAIDNLFEAESDRYEALLDAIRKKIETAGPPPRSAWMERPPKEFGDSLILGILHETRHIAAYSNQLRSELRKIEREFDITIEIKGYTKADIPAHEAGGAVHLYGITPFAEESAGELLAGARTHDERDRRLLRISRILSTYLAKDASLVRRAKVYVRGLLKNDQGRATKDIEEWRDILDSYSVRRLIRLLTASSEGANRLRQSCPLFAVLTADERDRIFTELGTTRERQ